MRGKNYFTKQLNCAVTFFLFLVVKGIFLTITMSICSVYQYYGFIYKELIIFIDIPINAKCAAKFNNEYLIKE